MDEYDDFKQFQAILDKSHEYNQWKQQKYTLDLFLDALDEARLMHSRFDHALIRHFRELDDDLIRVLRLRITCRTAELPNNLVSELEIRWGKAFGENTTCVATYHLAQLRREDIILDLGDETATEFLTQVDSTGIQVIAAHP